MNIRLYRKQIEENQAKMPISTNLNNGYACGFMMLTANLIESFDEHQREIVVNWMNRTFAYAEYICEYYYAYVWIYVKNTASPNSRLEQLAQTGLMMLVTKLNGQQENNYEKQKDTLLSVLKAWKSYTEIWHQQNAYRKEQFPEELDDFRQAGKVSWYREKQELMRYVVSADAS
jgi:hypothetical protein